MIVMTKRMTIMIVMTKMMTMTIMIMIMTMMIMIFRSQMAITASYWKTWQLLLIMTSLYPEEYGSVGWENYPTLR